MKKVKALKKDLRTKFSGTLTQAVNIEDPKPSKKVKKLISKTSRQLAAAVMNDTKKARKKAEKAEKKFVKAEKKEKKFVKAEKKKKKSVKKSSKLSVLKDKRIGEGSAIN